MANFNSNQDIDYKFENIKFENADIKMKAIFWDIIRKEQKALGEIDSKIDTIKDENLRQRLIKLSGRILDTLVKLYSSGDEISILFQQLDQTLQELGEIEDENIASIIANINYEPQEQVIKQEPVQVVEEPVIEQAPVKEPINETESTEEKAPLVEETKEEEPVVETSEVKEDEEENLNNTLQQEINNKEEIKEDSKGTEIEASETKEPVPVEVQEETKSEVKEEPVMAIPNIEEKKEEPTEINNQDISPELPEIVSNSTEEPQPEITPEVEPSWVPEIVGIDTSTKETPATVPVVEEVKDEDAKKELEPVQDEIQKEITQVETTEQKETVQEPIEPIPTIVEPVVESPVETADDNQPEEQQLEPQQETNQEVQSVTTPDIQVELPENKAENIEEQSIQEEVQQETQEEKKPDFIKTTDLPTKAILTTSKQITNLRNSRETQEALFTSINIKNRNTQQANIEPQMSTEEMLAQVEQLYSEGRMEEAEKLMEEITANSTQLQPVNTENYTNELNQIQPTDNMLNVGNTSDQKQFTLAA